MFLNPALLLGLAAIGAPILIHLLMRQRPRRVAWAAMRWLEAARRQAQRRYRLTNLLLLFLRCLAVALLAVALARPALTSFGGGGTLVVVVDTSASMGPLGRGTGALDAARAALADGELAASEAVLVTVGERVAIRARGSIQTVLAQLGDLRTEPVSGGLERAAEEDGLRRLSEAIEPGSDVLLVSDFRQDDGSALVGLLTPRVASVTRWRVGSDTDNALVTAVKPLGDLRPDRPGALELTLQGRVTSAHLAIDDGAEVPITLAPGDDGRVRLDLPPLAAGEHRLRLRLDDGGLRFDDHLEYPFTIADRLPVTRFDNGPGRLVSALAADRRAFAIEPGDPALVARAGLPTPGIVILRRDTGLGDQLAAWVAAGGILWSDFDRLRTDPALAALVETIHRAADPVPAGAVSTGEHDLDESFARVSIAELPALDVPARARILARAGALPLVAVLPVGRGAVVVETVDSESLRDFGLAGGFPTWVQRTARRLALDQGRPRQVALGSRLDDDLVLERHGDERRLAAGTTLALPLGAWRDGDGRDWVVLGNQREGTLSTRDNQDLATSLAAALPDRRGRDWGPWLLAALILLLLAEGRLAAWAGRTYALAGSGKPA